jgi:hypothetical protein
MLYGRYYDRKLQEGMISPSCANSSAQEVLYLKK